MLPIIREDNAFITLYSNVGFRPIITKKKKLIQPSELSTKILNIFKEFRESQSNWESKTQSYVNELKAIVISQFSERKSGKEFQELVDSLIGKNAGPGSAKSKIELHQFLKLLIEDDEKFGSEVAILVEEISKDILTLRRKVQNNVQVRFKDTIQLPLISNRIRSLLVLEDNKLIRSFHPKASEYIEKLRNSVISKVSEWEKRKHLVSKITERRLSKRDGEELEKYLRYSLVSDELFSSDISLILEDIESQRRVGIRKALGYLQYRKKYAITFALSFFCFTTLALGEKYVGDIADIVSPMPKTYYIFVVGDKKDGLAKSISDLLSEQGKKNPLIVRGHKLKFLYLNDDGDRNTAIRVANSIIQRRNNRDPILMIGHFRSTTTKAVLPLYLSAKIPILLLTETNDNLLQIEQNDINKIPIVRFTPTNQVQAKTAARLCLSHDKKYAWIAGSPSNPEYSENLSKLFAQEIEQGGKVFYRDVNNDLPERYFFENINVENKKINCIYHIGSEMEQSLTFIRYIRKLQTKKLIAEDAIIIASDSSANREFILKGGKDVDGIFVTSPIPIQYVADIPGYYASNAYTFLEEIISLTENREGFASSFPDNIKEGITRQYPATKIRKNLIKSINSELINIDSNDFSKEVHRIRIKGIEEKKKIDFVILRDSKTGFGELHLMSPTDQLKNSIRVPFQVWQVRHNQFIQYDLKS